LVLECHSMARPKMPNQSLSRTQGPLSNFIYNGLDFRSLSNVRPAVGPAFLHR
jgi:hypothetical protein